MKYTLLDVYIALIIIIELSINILFKNYNLKKYISFNLNIYRIFHFYKVLMDVIKDTRFPN